jgi:alginate O-acetyltransferase complex protein AlgI
MLFNSLEFALFLPIVFAVYWGLAKVGLRAQNALLLSASYFFYGCWDPRFLFLLMFSTLLDFYTGHQIQKAGSRRLKRTWLWISISINLAFLGIFKYYNFFVSSFSDMLEAFGLHANLPLIQVILPVGISFYTFHGLSYVIDIYHDRIKAERNFVDYALFVSFFALLVAGPIERATHLLPQIKQVRFFNHAHAVSGLRQMLWGLFKKVVVADNCAEYADLVFDDPGTHSGSTLFIGAVLFTFQIYCDFSGYSDIALGCARLFGITLMRNFAYPYFSRDIAEFWRRWHISLSSWFRDYLYIPLGGSRGGKWSSVRNTMIIFLVSGFWHGANWTYLAWGALNALYFIPLLLAGRNRTNLDTAGASSSLPSLRETCQIVTTFLLTILAWVFFRSSDLVNAFDHVAGIFSMSFFSIPTVRPSLVIALIAFLIIVEWSGRRHQFALEDLGTSWPRPLRWSMYYALIAAILVFGGKEQEFIYFQF